MKNRKLTNVKNIAFICWCLMSFCVFGYILWKNETLYSLSLTYKLCAVALSLLGGLVWNMDILITRQAQKSNALSVVLAAICLLISLVWVIYLVFPVNVDIPPILHAVNRAGLFELVMPFVAVNILISKE